MFRYRANERRHSLPAFVFVDTVTASTSVSNSNYYGYNLYDKLIAAGWNGTRPINATVTVNAGVDVFGHTYMTTAQIHAWGLVSPKTGFHSGNNAGANVTYPAGSTLTLINNGRIIGSGGYGGGSTTGSNGQYASGAGGIGIEIYLPTTITNNGTIAGGGSGGAGNSSCCGGGGAPYGLRGYNLNNFGNITFQANDGTLTAGGAGTINGSNSGGYGGAWGASGGISNPNSGSTPWAFPPAAGNSVVGNASITWLTTGTRIGSIS